MTRSHSSALCLLLAFLAPALIAMHSLVTVAPSGGSNHSAIDNAPCHDETPSPEVHSGTHACVGVLAAPVAIDADDTSVGSTSSNDLAVHAAQTRRVDGRWPPWTTPTSAQLSIWRV